MDNQQHAEMSPAYGDLGPTPPSISSDRATHSSQPSGAIKRLIGELGLRYRPSAQADLEAHAAALALLARDVADVPPTYLERAIREWVRDSQFMPRANELIELARSYLPKSDSDKDFRVAQWIERGNAGLAAQGKHNAHWVFDKTTEQYSIEPTGAH
jgi:hypothetical protein